MTASLEERLHDADPGDLHTPVMLDRCLELLAPVASRPGAVVVDATLGMGGHSAALLARHPGLTVIGLDRDPDALRLASRRLAPWGERAILVHTVYDRIAETARGAGFDQVDGVLFDLGVSSLQLDESERGFAYAKDAPLDMRMDQTSGVTAAEVLATAPEGRLRAIFERYGEEPLAGRYARAIVAARAEAHIERSAQLVEVLQAATPAALRDQRHPAKRVFQALRIEVTGTNGVEYAYDLTFDPVAAADDADVVFQADGLPVIVPAGSIEQLTGATLAIPTGGGPGLVLRNPNRPNPLAGRNIELTGTVPEKIEQLLREQINPALASHGGFANLVGVEDDKAYVTMGGGCQGCAVSAMTLRDGIARSITEAIPEITEVIDTTDHAAGENPFY